MRYFLLWLCLTPIGGSFTFGEPKLPDIFGNHMVLQQDTEICVWGTAQPQEKIQVTGSWQDVTVSANADSSGNWEIHLQTPKAGGPYQLRIDGRKTIVFDDVLIGEVWLCSGQSNMKWPVNQVHDAENEIENANYPQIRLKNGNNEWNVCGAATVGGFSGTGYFFGRFAHQNLNVPVGLINCSAGGTRIEQWIPEKFMSSDAFGKALMQQASAPELVEQVKKWQKDLVQWRKKTNLNRQNNTAAKKESIPKRPELEPLAFKLMGFQNPGTSYARWVEPIVRFRMKGVIWYQGESNALAGTAYEYRELLPLMIKGWRQAANQPELPFLLVQLPNYEPKSQQPGPAEWAVLRESIFQTYRNVANTGMIVTIDIGESDLLHPPHKQDVGKRLGLCALKKCYGKNEIICSGPLYEYMEIKANKAVIHFTNGADGLAASDFQKLKGFTIASEKKEFLPAQAEIVGDTVVVSHAAVANPVAVRYAWANDPICNLCNKAGLPASPFRTDRW